FRRVLFRSWLWKKPAMYSKAAVEWHFWIATTGIVLYISSMWVSGIMEGLMWREYTPDGFLANSFIETVSAKHIQNVIRVLGGAMFFSGAVIMAWNVWKTIRMPGADARTAPPVHSEPHPLPAE